MTASNPSLDPQIAIRAQGLTRRFGSFTAVNNFNLTVNKGNIYGFIGPNGSGKTTVIRMLCGLLRPSAGAVNVLNLHLPDDAEALRLRIGYMTQKFSLYEDLSLTENLFFFGQIYGIEKSHLKRRIDQLLQDYSLRDIAQQLAGSISGGQKRRLALATATLHKPDLLFLDEPTSEVDPENRRLFWEKLFDLADSGTTILVSTHFMDEAERCHRLAILNEGELCAEGEPQQLMASLAATIVEIEADDMRPIKNQLHALEHVKSTTQQGLRLRVFVDEQISDPADYLHQHLLRQDPANPLHVKCQAVHASLEDVFVNVTKYQTRQ